MEQKRSYRICIAPMMDWTDRHCRRFHRQLSRCVRLYTEMISAKALVYGNAQKLLDFNACEYPVALQIGGAEVAELLLAARLGERAGYDEINLNCGCPSERVQQGVFGACLMRKPHLVATCVRALRDAVALPITIKHRIGLDQDESYEKVRDFVGIVAEGGCQIFIVHARNAWLQGLDPKQNRSVPALRYGVVCQLKQDFPELTFVLNGGLRDHATAKRFLVPDRDLSGTLPCKGDVWLDGVMFGRWAYEDPWMLSRVDSEYFRLPDPVFADGPLDDRAARCKVALEMSSYLRAEVRRGTFVRAVVRPLLGLFNGLPGARLWRRFLSDSAQLTRFGEDVIERALESLGNREFSVNVSCASLSR